MQDISGLLADWPFEPDGIQVRMIRGADGRERIQLRLDLGLLQMELDDRPDGRRIQGHVSWLDYYEAQAAQQALSEPLGEEFSLDSAACVELLREGVQYYHRYLSFWHLRRYALCARDTERNLRLFAFVRRYARQDGDKMQFDQWRPYVTMMHTRAVAMPLVEDGEFLLAISEVEAGIAGIEQFLSDYNQEDRIDSLREVVFLRRWKQEIFSQLKAARGEVVKEYLQGSSELAPAAGSEESEPAAPDDLLSQLTRALQSAITEERYEEAARLRDEIRRQEMDERS